MLKISDVRAKFPQYSDLSDADLAERIYQAHYSDMDHTQFMQRIGLAGPQKAVSLPTAPALPTSPDAPAPFLQQVAGIQDPQFPADVQALMDAFLPRSAPVQPSPRPVLDPILQALTAPRAAPQSSVAVNYMDGLTLPQTPQVAPEPTPFDGEPLLDLMTRRGQQAVQGFADVPASVPEAAAIVMTDAQRAYQAGPSQLSDQRAQQIAQLEAAASQPGLDPARKQWFDAQITALREGQDVLASEDTRRNAGGPAVSAQDRALFQRGDQVRDFFSNTFGKPDSRDQSFWGKVAQGAGNMAGFLTAAPLGPLSVPAGAALGASLNTSSLYKEALEAGATEDVAHQAARWGALIGASEIVPIARALKLLPQGMRQQVSEPLFRQFAHIAQSAGEEAAQEFLAGFANNIVAQQLFDPERGWTENLGEQALIGGILGAGTGALGVALDRPGRTPAAPQEPQEQAAGPTDAAVQAGGANQPQMPVEPSVGAAPPPAAGDAPRLPAAQPTSAPQLPGQMQAPGAQGQLAPSMTRAEVEANPQRYEIIDEAEGQGSSFAPTGRQVVLDNDTGRVFPLAPDSAPTEQGNDPLLQAMLAPAAPVQPNAPQAQTQEQTDGEIFGQDGRAGEGLRGQGRQGEIAQNQGGEVQPPQPAQRPNQPDNIEFIDAAGVQQIGTEPGVMQYKAGGDADGVTDRLRGVTEWRPERAGMSIIYEYADGRRVIADGHQRLGLAKRLASEGKRIQMPAMILRQVDGVTPQEARTTAALKNIAEGSGTAIDAAKVLRDTDQTPDQLGLPPSSALVRDAMGLRNLSDVAFGMVVNQVASERDGGIVGRVVTDKAAQADILALLTRLKPANAFQAESIAKQAAADTVTETQDSLFGPESDTQNLYLERAKVLDAASKMTRDELKAFKTVTDNADRLEAAGNVLDAQGNQKQLDTAASVRDYLQRAANTKGPISDALSVEARAVKSGKPVARAARDFLAAVERELAARGGERPSSDQGGQAAGSQRPQEPGDQGLDTRDDSAAGGDLFGNANPSPTTAVSPQPEPDDLFGATPQTGKTPAQIKAEAEADVKAQQSMIRKPGGNAGDAGPLFSPDQDMFAPKPEPQPAAAEPESFVTTVAELERRRDDLLRPFVNLPGQNSKNAANVPAAAYKRLMKAVAAAPTIEARHRAADAWVRQEGIAENREHMVVFSADGVPISVTRGLVGSAGGSYSVSNTLNSAYYVEQHGAAYTTHNHPVNSSFSPSDITTMASGFKVLVAVGHDGSYNMAKPGKHMPELPGLIRTPDDHKDVEKFRSAINEVDYIATNKVTHAYWLGTGQDEQKARPVTRAVVSLFLHRLGVISYSGDAGRVLEIAGIEIDAAFRQHRDDLIAAFRRSGFFVAEVSDPIGDRPGDWLDGPAGLAGGKSGKAQDLDANAGSGAGLIKIGSAPAKGPAKTGNDALDGALDDLFGEGDDAAGTGNDMERSGRDGASADSMGGTDVPASARKPGRGNRKGSRADQDGDGQRPASGRLPGGNAAPVGAGSNPGADGSGGTDQQPAASGGRGGRSGGGRGRLPADTGRGADPAGNASGAAPGKLTPAQQLAAIRGILKEDTLDFVAGPERRRTDSDAFRKWFGDSKVVDADGRPLVVYHASTYGDFDAFDVSEQRKGMAGYGFYFTDSFGQNIYTDYGMNFQAQWSWNGREKKVNVMPVFLNISNPLITPDIRVVQDRFARFDKGTFGQGRIYAGLSADALTAVQRAGYDGVITNEHVKRQRNGSYKVVEPGAKGAIKHPVYVAFAPEQIKSIFNRGTWDASSPYMLREDSADPIDPRKAEALRSIFIGALDGVNVKQATDRDLFRSIIMPLRDAGMTRDEVAQLSPYLTAFLADLRAGRVNMDPDPAPTALDRLNAAVPGWTAMNGMLTNPDPERGGIIDRAALDKKWFVVLNGSTRSVNMLDTVDQAVDWFIQNHAASAKPKPAPRVIPGDRENIDKTLPQLLPEQRDDVFKIETRFAKPDGHGFMLTNGTGTGKTYSGGGQVARFHQQGKKNILIIAPDATHGGWARTLDALGVPSSKLADTKDAGEGVVYTTPENAGANAALATREWDLVVVDEAQKLSSNKDGSPTSTLNTLRAITHRPDELWRKSRMLHADDWAKHEAMKDGEAKTAFYRRLKEREDREIQAWAQKPRSKVLFLSATPFAYDKSIDYAEGYLFKYPEDGKVGRSNQDGRAIFMVQNFGYRIRYHKLTRPEHAVDSAVFEREFHEKLKREGVLSGRSLQVDVDYDRRFVTVADAIGTEIDAILKTLSEGSSHADTATKEGYRTLNNLMRSEFGYLARMQLLEAIKAKAAVADIRKHLAMGRKVVVFHDFNKGGGFNPFAPLRDMRLLDDANALKALADLTEKHPGWDALDFTGYPAPALGLKAAFGKKAGVFSGLTKKDRDEQLAAFNTDKSGVDVLIVQADAGGAGVSMHDVTGTHQRVMINLGMPTKPTTTLQQEGRILRVGTKTDAAFRYYTIGTAWERTAFAQRIAERSGTVENLALGNEARAITEAFVDAYMDAEAFDPSDADGRGGKAKDRAGNITTPWQKAISYYFARAKMRGRRDQREGLDFYPTPEPLGLKMVEWAGIRANERVLEPSAGDGAIARFMPDDAAVTIVEPSDDLGSTALLRAPRANLAATTFEQHHISNKYHVVVMNPPFGSGGKTAMDHLAKAAKHLRPGGRLVALIPSGPSADKRYDAWWNSEDAKDFNWTADISLPPVTFERAGTGVMSRVVILDKIPDTGERAMFGSRQGGTKRINFTGAGTITDFFDRLERYDVPRRPDPKQDVVEELEAEGQDAGTPAPVLRPGPPVGGNVQFKLDQTVHGKTGEPLFVAAIANRVERDVYTSVLAIAKQHGGWYSSFRGNGAKPGFQFKSEAARQAFIDDMAKPTVARMEETAYHGTPHDFDRFSLEAIGTGEGAQVYGWGLYFAGRKGVAEFYRRTLARRPIAKLRGTAVEDQTGFLANAIKNIGNEMDGGAVSFAVERDIIIADLRQRAEKERRAGTEKNAKEADDAADTLEGVTEADISWRGGSLFAVDIPESTDLLDWEADIFNQPAKVQERLAPVLEAMRKHYRGKEKALNGGIEGFMRNLTGREVIDFLQSHGAMYGFEPDGYSFAKRLDPKVSYVIHQVVNDRTGDVLAEADSRLYALRDSGIRPDQYASLALRKLGIPGHRYLDGSSRSSRGGSRTVFTPNGFDVGINYTGMAGQSALSEMLIDLPGTDSIAESDFDDALDEVIYFMQSGGALTSAPGKKLWELAQAAGWREGVRDNVSHNFVIYDDAAIQIIAKEQRAQLVREAAASTEEIRRMLPRLRAELDRLDLKRVKLSAREGDPGWQGAFAVTGDGEMEILIGASLDPMKTLHHEAIHALRAMNLFTPEEWKALTLAAERKWLAKHDIAARYPHLTEAERIEEAIAEEFSEALASKQSPKGSILVQAFNKIARILRALRNVLKGAGYQTPEEIFGRVLAGEIGARNAGNTGRQAGMAMQRRKAAPEGQGDLFAQPSPAPTSGMTADQRRELEARAQQSKMRKAGGNSGDAGPLFNDDRDLFGDRMMFQRPPLAVRPLTPQGRAHRNSAMGATPFIPDRRVWESLTAAGVPIWQRLRDLPGAASDAVDRARFTIQDRFLPVLRAQEAVMRQTGRPLPKEHDAYLAETTFSGKVGRHLLDIDERFTKPIIQTIAASKGRMTSETVGEYLYARHAVERNAYIASINPNMPDGGSGMMDADAQAILAQVAASPDAAAYARIGQLVDDMREWSIALREDTGLISNAQAALWRTQYRHYVPLKGFEETDHAEALMDLGGVRMGRRFSIRGQETRRALGRQSEAFNPLQSAITMSQEVAIRAEKNRVAQTLYDLAKNYPSKALWEVKKPKQKRYFNRSTGLVETRVEDPVSMMMEPNEMAVKISGQEHRILFNDQRLAEAAGTLGADQMSGIMRILSVLSRFFSMTRTMLNLEFMVTNAFRDFQTAQFNIQAFGENDKARIAKAMAKNWRKAFMGAMRGSTYRFDTEWSRYYDEFQKAGAQVWFWTMENPEAGREDLNRRINLARGNKAVRALKVMTTPSAFFSFRDNAALSFIERTNLAVDNAIRLAAFVEARRAGWDVEKAAFLAKELTVNFNRRGEAGSTLNALYPFFNAAIQGTVRTVKAISSRRVALMVLAAFAGGALLDLINASLSEEDDDGELLYDKVPNWRNERNLHLVLWGTGDNPAAIPMPYGYNVFPYAGQQLGKVLRGVKQPDQAFGDVVAAIFGAYSPISAATPAQMVSPFISDPLVEMAENKNWLGIPIYPEKYGNQTEPDAYVHFRGATEVSKWVAQTLNSMTGGDFREPGAIDVSPETLDHLASFVVGSAGAFWGRSADVLTKALQGDFESIEGRNVPFLRNVTSPVGEWADRDRYFRFGAEVKNARADAKAYTDAGVSVPAKTADLASLYDAWLAAERERSARGEWNPSRANALAQREESRVMLDFNRRYIAVMGRQGE